MKINGKKYRFIYAALALTACAVLCAVLIACKNRNVPFQTVDGCARVEFFGTYGTHLNINITVDSSLIENKKTSLVLKNDESETEFALISEEEDDAAATRLTLSNEINGGVYLETVPEGEYLIFLKLADVRSDSEKNVYYTLSNETAYNEADYYTIEKDSSTGERTYITIGFDEASMYLKAEKKALPEDIYDIIIEVGHGGDDPGAVAYYNGEELMEKDLNRLMATELEKQLTEAGYKVRLSHYEDVDIDYYGKAGRATLPNETKAKYCFSLHNNASIGSVYRGVEIYAPYNADYTFAKLIAESVVENTNAVFSNNADRVRVSDGVFIRTFDDETTPEMLLQAQEYKFEPYDITYETNYYFMIREVGGKVTGAYTDGRNPSRSANEFVDSNNTAEGYLLELGYIDNEENLYDLMNNYKNYAEAVANAVTEYLTTERSTTQNNE